MQYPLVCDDSEILRMLLGTLLLIGYWCLNRYVNCFTLDWNQLAFAVPETVINLIVGRCFCYHETDHIIWFLFSYVPGTISAFNHFSKNLIPVSDSPLLTNAVIVIVIVIITQ